MTPFEAAIAYLALAATNEIEAVRFSMRYEDEICQTEEDFDTYLELVGA